MPTCGCAFSVICGTDAGAASTAQAVVAAVMAAAARMAAVVFLIFIVKTSSNSCSCRCAGERLACRGALFESD